MKASPAPLAASMARKLRRESCLALSGRPGALRCSAILCTTHWKCLTTTSRTIFRRWSRAPTAPARFAFWTKPRRRPCDDMSNATRITLLAGGVGGAKLAEGLAHSRYGSGLTIIGNVGDDHEF